jgi:hypothetical protein
MSHSTFYKRIRNEYHNRKDFYALSYDADEVIDAVSHEMTKPESHIERCVSTGFARQRGSIHQPLLRT